MFYFPLLDRPPYSDRPGRCCDGKASSHEVDDYLSIPGRYSVGLPRLGMFLFVILSKEAFSGGVSRTGFWGMLLLFPLGSGDLADRVVAGFFFIIPVLLLGFCDLGLESRGVFYGTGTCSHSTRDTPPVFA